MATRATSTQCPLSKRPSSSIMCVLWSSTDSSRALMEQGQLVKAGFKEIEVAYPAASETDFNFVRGLVEQKLGEAEGVWIQVSSSHFRRSSGTQRSAGFDASSRGPHPENVRLGTRRQAGHSAHGSSLNLCARVGDSDALSQYNATSPCFRKVVFNNSKEQTVDLATKHTKLVRQLIDESVARGDGTEWQYEYSPETFTQTEGPFAVEICNRVQEVFFAGKDRSKEHPIIFNLPATVEVSTPNVYADQVRIHL